MDFVNTNAVGEDDLVRRSDVLSLLYGVKDDKSAPKNYGTLLGLISEVRSIPCATVVRPGDHVFVLVGKEISNQKVNAVTLYADKRVLIETNRRRFFAESFGKSVFFSEEDARQAVEGGK